MSQFCTYHGSWAVVTCAKLWHDMIINFHATANCNLISFGLWAHKPFVRWILEHHHIFWKHMIYGLHQTLADFPLETWNKCQRRSPQIKVKASFLSPTTHSWYTLTVTDSYPFVLCYLYDTDNADAYQGGIRETISFNRGTVGEKY